MKLLNFLKNWTLPIAMITGVVVYFVYANIALLASTKPFVNSLVDILMPLLIFIMLFLSFCRVDLTQIRLKQVHIWLLVIQLGSFLILSLPLVLFPNLESRIYIESAMLCIITPTASAAAVVTHKLGGNTTSLITFTILSNFASSIFIPLVFSMTCLDSSISFFHSFLLILIKVFPLLIIPLVLAYVFRKFLPQWHKIIVAKADMAFYLWSIGLIIAVGVTVRSLMHSEVGLVELILIAFISLVCCVLQFYVGRKVGGFYGDQIGGGQSLGQKNTSFTIWLSITFLTPVTSLAGGFYIIWHNIYNSYQLYRKRKPKIF